MLDTQRQIEVEGFWFPAGGSHLSGRLYKPMAEPETAVVLNSATGVPREYYRHFAQWLAEDRGIACLTFDYSGFGHSLTGRMRDATVKMSDWALIDMPAARAEMRMRYPQARQWTIGHSIGGMMGPIQPDVAKIDRLICVCSGLVTLSDHPWPYRALAALFWYGHVPILTKALGYLPGKAVGFGEDLPAEVYWQWRRWCTNPQNYMPEIGHALPGMTWSDDMGRVDLISFCDDEMVPPAAVWRLADLFGPNAHRHLIDPQDHGLPSIGHIGAFARRNSAVWPHLIS